MKRTILILGLALLLAQGCATVRQAYNAPPPDPTKVTPDGAYIGVGLLTCALLPPACLFAVPTLAAVRVADHQRAERARYARAHVDCPVALDRDALERMIRQRRIRCALPPTDPHTMRGLDPWRGP